MSEQAELLARVLADPDDDGARLVYADALSETGDPRGELIAAQLALAARGIHGTADLVAADVADAELVPLAGLLRRVNQLLAQHAGAWTREWFGIAEIAVEYRRGMPDSVRLDTMLSTIDLEAFVRAVGRSTVRSLHLAWAKDDVLTALARHPPPNLRALGLSDPRPTDPRLLDRVIASLPALEAFRISASPRPIGVADDYKFPIATLAPLHRLVELGLFSTNVDRADLDALARLPFAGTLRSLAIHNAKIGDDIATVLDGRFPALADASLHLCRIGPGAFAGRTLQIPRKLSLGANRELHRSVASLLAQPTVAQLESLDLSSCFLSSNSVEEIARCAGLPRLSALRIDQASISDRTFDALAHSASARLTELHVSQTETTAAGLATLLASDRHALRVLDCWPSEDARDGRAMARALAEAPHAATLRDLRLHECQLVDEDVSLLAQAPKLASLRRLVAAGNRIGNAGARALARSHQPLVTLGLWNNHIADAGLRAFFDTPTLVELFPNAGSTVNQLDDPELAARLRAHLGAGFSVGRDPIPRGALQVVFPGTPPLTHEIVREVLAALPLVVTGDATRTIVRDPRHPDAGALTIWFSHDRENDWCGIASIGYRVADQTELGEMIAAIANTLAIRTGGRLYTAEDRAADTRDD